MLPPCTRDPEGLALLAACKENPADKAPKLILSDWLEEQGEDEVAHCLRKSLQFGTSVYSLPAQVLERWRPLNSCRDGWLCLTPDPTKIEEQLGSLSECEWFGAISFANVPAEIARRSMINQRAMKHVVALESSVGWPFLSDQPRDSDEFKYLSDLNFEHSRIDSEDVRSVCTDRRIRRLQELRLGSSPLHGECFRYLEEAAWISGLALLAFEGTSAGTEYLLKFFSGKSPASLEALCLENAGTGNDALQALAEARSCPKLSQLQMTRMLINSRGIRSLFRCFENQKINYLDLSGNLFGDPGVRQLSRWKGLRDVTQLRLNHVGLASKGLEAIAHSKHLGKIRTLDIGDNRLLDDNHLDHLIGFENESLKILRLNSCDLGSKSLSNLSSWPMVQVLETCDLTSNRMGEDGFAELAKANFCQLNRLFLADNFLGDAGIVQFADATNWRKLTTLSLAHNGIGHLGMEALSFATHLENLRVINLAGNPIGDTGLAALASGKWLTNIEELFLSQTDITDSGIKSLLDSDLSDHLTKLNFWGNQITDTGAELLANCEQLSSLTDLYISNEHLTDRGRSMLKNSPHLRHTFIHW